MQVDPQTPEVTKPIIEVAPQESAPETVAREEYERAKAETAQVRLEAKKHADAVERLKMQGLKEKEDWQKVAGEYETKYEEAVKERDQMRSAIVTDKKMSSIKLEAKKHGIIDSAIEDLELLAFPEVAVETTSTGRVNVLGCDRAMQRLKASKPHWFSKNPPQINPGSPEVNQAGRVSYEELKKSGDAARKSGDWREYKDLLTRFRTNK